MRHKGNDLQLKIGLKRGPFSFQSLMYYQLYDLPVVTKLQRRNDSILD